MSNNDKHRPLLEDISTLSEKELEERGYYRLPDKSVLTQLNMLVQNVPDHIVGAMQTEESKKAIEKMTENAYTVIIEDGMHLGKSRANIEAFKGMAFSKENELKGMPDLVKLSADGVDLSITPQLALGFFNVMSFATGQYFLTEINCKLSDLEKGVGDVLSFLEREQRSKIEADEKIIYQTFCNLKYIMENEVARVSTITDLKRIRNEELRNINSLRAEISETISVINKKTPVKEFVESQKKCRDAFPKYMCAVRNYCNAFFLETVISTMDDGMYLLNVHSDMQEKVFDYECSFKTCEEKFNKYASTAKDLNKKKIIPEEAERLSMRILTTNPWILGVKGVVAVSAGIDSYRVYMSKTRQKKVEKEIDQFRDACSNLEPLNETIRLISNYRNLQNSPIEMLVIRDSAYIKAPKEDEVFAGR